MKRLGFGSVLVLSALVIGARVSHADSIVLTSQAPGVFGYGIQLDPLSGPVTVVNGDTLTFTGLFGVTGASSAPGIGFTETFTSTSVTFTETGGGATTIGNPGSTSLTLNDFFFINSADTTVGNVSYTSVSNLGTISGTTSGPVTPQQSTSTVPEPSSLILAGSGLLGLAGAMRRKLVR